MSVGTIYAAIGYRLYNDTNITDTVGTRIYHGNRPAGSAPCINYFEVSYEPLHNGVIESSHYQISHRASKPEDAQAMARRTCVLFHNFQGVIDGFDIQSAKVQGKHEIFEPDSNLYHVPVDVRFTQNDSTWVE